MLGQIMIFQHPDYVQSFDEDRLVLADDLRCEFLKRVPSGVADFGVQLRHFQSGLLSIVAILDLARQTTLKSFQSHFPSDERTRIFKFLALARRGQRLNANVYADFGFDSPSRLDIGFNKDADKMASACIPADRQINDFGIVGKRTTPGNIERLGLLGHCDATISKGEGVGGIASRLALASRFKLRILRSLLKEISEGRVEIKQGLLKNDSAHFGKKGFLGLFLPLSEFGRCEAIANGFLLLLPGRSAIFQSLIVNIASAAEGFSELSRLFISRKESVFEGLLDYHRNILQPIDGHGNHR